MFGNMRSQFGDDPFFSMHQDHLRGTDEIFSSFFNSDPFPALTDGSEPRRDISRGRRGERSGDRDFDGSRDLMMGQNPFQSMNAIMKNMHSMMGNLSQHTSEVRSDPNAQMYSQSSSYMTYSNANGGQPKVFQATTASRQMPGGLKETRKSVRDSEAALEKMAIGRHINERGHVITRQRDMRSGTMDENRDYFNMAEEDAPHFDNEWREKAQRYYGGQGGLQHQDHSRAIDNNRTRRNVPALESGAHDSRQGRHSKHR